MSNMVVQTNILALNSHRNMKGIGNLQAKASARLSSGYRINSAADDAAGLAISEKMRAQIRGLDMASKNAQDAISLIQTAEGGLTEVDNMIQRIRELTVQAANDTNTTNSIEESGTKSAGVKGDRHKILAEISQLISEIGVTAGRIRFNNRTLLSSQGGVSSGYKFQVGPNASDLLSVKVSINLMSIASALKNTNSIWKGSSTAVSISSYLKVVDKNLTAVVQARAQLGAYQNRLEYTIKSLDTSSENLSASESRIRDTDMAKEMMSLTKANILQQTSTSMLAQANQSPQSILKLLQ